jgi:putative addiction module CopG family antidote
MASSYSLGPHFEAFIKAQLASGRYGNASEVLRDALRLMEESEKNSPPSIKRSCKASPIARQAASMTRMMFSTNYWPN